MRSFSVCVLLSLAGAAYCMPISDASGQDEGFAEVCVFTLFCLTFIPNILYLTYELYILRTAIASKNPDH